LGEKLWENWRIFIREEGQFTYKDAKGVKKVKESQRGGTSRIQGLGQKDNNMKG